ncbi:MAG: CPBP family intramembrane metalloprotease [Myxococcaceae bacterium]|nr:CPBP family intramembrane metalloprotease [Myxococcaceae bacterium]
MVLFFALAFAFTWLPQLPAVLAHHGFVTGGADPWLPLTGLGAFGPMFAAIVCVWREPSGVRKLFAPLKLWRVSPVWYVAGLANSAGLLFVGLAIASLFGREGPWFYPPRDAPHLVAAVVFSFGEEIGWRGYALPRLVERHGGLVASVIIGVVWCFWHALMFDLAGLPPWLTPALVPFFVGGSIVFTFIWARGGRSLLLMVLAHLSAHLNNSGQALPSDWTPTWVHLAAYVLVALALVALTRDEVTG